MQAAAKRETKAFDITNGIYQALQEFRLIGTFRYLIDAKHGDVHRRSSLFGEEKCGTCWIQCFRLVHVEYPYGTIESSMDPYLVLRWSIEKSSAPPSSTGSWITSQGGASVHG